MVTLSVHDHLEQSELLSWVKKESNISVEQLKSVSSASSRDPLKDMIDSNPGKQTRSLTSPASDGKRDASHSSMSPGQSTRQTESPSLRRNSSPATLINSSAKLTPPSVLRPLEIQSPNSLNLQLPPTCGAKQLAKLKRFLTTLQQFGSEISTEIGERVRALVLTLVNSQMTIEDFHAKLQETTNFPLKPFVIPFLKATLPSLQRELLQCAQLSRQSPQQYLSNNERVIFDAPPAGDSHGDSVSSISPEFRDDSVAHKRKVSPIASSHSSDIPPPKRLVRDSSPASHRSSRSPPHTILNDTEPGLLPPGEKRMFTEKDLLPTPMQIKLEDISRMFRARLESSEFNNPHRFTPGSISNRDNISPDSIIHEEENWRRVETMLSDVSGLVEKAKSAMATLQESRVKETQEFSLWMRRHAEGIDQDYKKRTGEIMSQTIRQSEDRIAEIRRQADETVKNVKRQALLEIHQAVTAAEVKANELVNQERARMENVLLHIKKAAKDDAVRAVNKQAESPENCWNCGRRASETCSGCNQARYCGQFCQHKDWDRHHTSCREGKEKSKEEAVIPSPTTVETKKEKS
ncbi:protein CBFA2T3-like isoform X2 [Watersipora subatra]|uniref:protein CBFA2T3-like isoform X2 n=1 Tax=Watersipora subatra TaxID=2589382 RepID=UPI00355B4866